MGQGALGRVYAEGEVIVRQGDPGECMFVIQSGEVEVLSEGEGREVLLRVAREGELLGEMAVFERETRSATLRARGTARLLTLDKKNFLRRIHEDPGLAVRIVELMSRRVRELSIEVARLRGLVDSRG